jgi:hypothetical protein
MTRNKIFSFVLIVAMAVALFAAIPAGTAQASTLGSGTILSFSLKTDAATSITTGVVSLLGTGGTTQKISVSLETAIKMGLVIPNPEMIGENVTINDVSGKVNSLDFVTDDTTNITTLTVNLTPDGGDPQEVSVDLEQAFELDLVIVNPDMVGTDVVIDPADILDSTSSGKGSSELETFFGPALGLTAGQLADYKTAGFGYGEIAQACWMATQLGGDAALLDQILMAKQSGDFSGLMLPDGKIVTNWGQLRKAVLTDPHQNLGQIMSGHADPLAITTPTETPAPLMSTQGSSHGHGKGHGKGGNK